MFQRICDYSVFHFLIAEPHILCITLMDISTFLGSTSNPCAYVDPPKVFWEVVFMWGIASG
jgi:hypothetical protein